MLKLGQCNILSIVAPATLVIVSPRFLLSAQKNSSLVITILMIAGMGGWENSCGGVDKDFLDVHQGEAAARLDNA